MNPSMKKFSHSGITLIEVMVTLFLFTLIIGGLYANLLVGNTAWQSFESAVVVQQEARRALSALVKDFRMAENLNVMPTDRILTISFHHPKEGNVTYFWAKTGPQQGQLFRQSATAIRNVGRLISQLDVSLNGRMVRVQLTAKTVSRQGKEIVVSLGQRVTRRR